MAPEISIIVPMYGEFPWLKEALRSLLENDFRDWEAILVDDGSPTDPAPVVAEFLKDERFRCLKHEHGGIACARNFGLRSARGAWVAFLDQDDRVLPGRFDAQLDAARRGGPELAGVYSDYERIRASGKLWDRYTGRAVAPERFLAECLGEDFPLAIGAALLRRGWIERAKGFDPELSGYDEGDLVIRIALMGGGFSYVPGVVHQWRDHGDNTMKSPGFQVERRLRYLAKLEALAEAHPQLKGLLPDFRSLCWYKAGLHHAESGEWTSARKLCWQAWRENPRNWNALYLAAKAALRA